MKAVKLKLTPEAFYAEAKKWKNAAAALKWISLRGGAGDEDDEPEDVDEEEEQDEEEEEEDTRNRRESQQDGVLMMGRTPATEALGDP